MDKYLRSLYSIISEDLVGNYLTTLMKNYKAVLFEQQKILEPVLTDSSLKLNYISIRPIIKEVCLLTYFYIISPVDRIEAIHELINIEKQNNDYINNDNNKRIVDNIDNKILIKIMYNIISTALYSCGITDKLDKSDAKFYVYKLDYSYDEFTEYVESKIFPFIEEKRLNFDFDFEYLYNPISSAILKSHDQCLDYKNDTLKDYIEATKGIYDIIRFINETNSEYNNIMNNIVNTEPIVIDIINRLMELESIQNTDNMSHYDKLIELGIVYSDTIGRSNLYEPNSIVIQVYIVGTFDEICSIGIHNTDESKSIITIGFIEDDDELSVTKKHWSIDNPNEYGNRIHELISFFNQEWNDYWYDNIINRFSKIDRLSSTLDSLNSDLYDIIDDDQNDEYKNEEDISNNIQNTKLTPSQLFDNFYSEAQSKGMSINDSLKYATDKCNDEYKNSN